MMPKEQPVVGAAGTEAAPSADPITPTPATPTPDPAPAPAQVSLTVYLLQYTVPAVVQNILRRLYSGDKRTVADWRALVTELGGDA